MTGELKDFVKELESATGEKVADLYLYYHTSAGTCVAEVKMANKKKYWARRQSFEDCFEQIVTNANA